MHEIRQYYRKAKECKQWTILIRYVTLNLVLWCEVANFDNATRDWLTVDFLKKQQILEVMKTIKYYNDINIRVYKISINSDKHG